jgi:hypothetical protein
LIIPNKIIENHSLAGKITQINNSAFNFMSNLTGNLIIPPDIQIIGSDAFKNCDYINGNLVLPKSITEIGTNAFLKLGCQQIYLNAAWEYQSFVS